VTRVRKRRNEKECTLTRKRKEKKKPYRCDSDKVPLEQYDFIDEKYRIGSHLMLLITNK
jgi:hypothetical protein